VGETQKRPFQLSFNSSLRVEFQGARVTSDGGLILVCLASIILADALTHDFSYRDDAGCLT
jgi:hypothetical protein